MKRLLRPASLQARLLVLLLGLVALVWLGVALLIWSDARHELDELLDGHLAQAAALLVVQQAHPEKDDVADAPSLHKYAPRVAFQVFHEGQLVMRSANAGTLPMTSRREGFETARLPDGAQWRLFATHGAELDVRVVVAEQTESRNSILWAVLRSLMLPLVLALPLLGMASWWAVRQGMAPLRQLSHSLAQRRAQDLAPITLANMPSEMQPMVQALNELFQRIERMVESERRFTADAAHELRTPIAAIRTQAQVAMGAGNDSAQRDHALNFALAACDRATHLVEQLLMLARLESASAKPFGAMDLSATARRVAAALAPTAMARQQTLELEAERPLSVAGDETLISVLVRNLIDNAMRYSPNGARILVSVLTETDQTILRVQDSGPGMTEAQLTRLGERFYRVLGSEQPGSGLGWSIVKRIAGVSGAKVQAGRSDDLGGLAVCVYWPAAK